MISSRQYLSPWFYSYRTYLVECMSTSNIARYYQADETLTKLLDTIICRHNSSTRETSPESSIFTTYCYLFGIRWRQIIISMIVSNNYIFPPYFSFFQFLIYHTWQIPIDMSLVTTGRCRLPKTFLDFVWELYREGVCLYTAIAMKEDNRNGGVAGG